MKALLAFPWLPIFVFALVGCSDHRSVAIDTELEAGRSGLHSLQPGQILDIELESGRNVYAAFVAMVGDTLVVTEYAKEGRKVAARTRRFPSSELRTVRLRDERLRDATLIVGLPLVGLGLHFMLMMLGSGAWVAG